MMAVVGHRDKFTVIGVLGAFAFLVLLVVSPDSWLHCLWDHHDSAWFFTCGKAWMSGMTPYVDFADSKGPLLWLIYGVGYLISPRDFTGVFLLSCLFYTATFYYCYMAAQLFLHDARRSVVVAMLMAVFFFFPGVHYEVRAEDYMLLFGAIAFYHLCRVLVNDAALGSVFNRASWAMGGGLAATFLIKYNGTLMLLAPTFVLLLLAARRGRLLWGVMWRIVAGAVAVILPFAFYMFATGCFDDFVREYFVNTMATLENNRWRRINYLWFVMAHKDIIVLLVMVAVSVLISFVVLKRYWWVSLFLFLWYGLVIAHNAHWSYYYASISIVALFGLIALFSRVKVNIAASVIAFVLVPLFLGISLLCRNDVAWFFNFPQQRAHFERCVAIMSQVERPRILYYNMNGSYDVPVDGLPACRYWASQNGSTAEMDSMQVATIMQGKAHFVFMLPSSPMNDRMDSTVYYRIPSHLPEVMNMYCKK